MFNPLRSV